MGSVWKCVYALSPLPPPLFPLLSLAAVNPDVCTGNSALAPACRVPGVLSAVRDVWQQDRDGMTSGPGHVGRVSRQRCGQTGMWQWSPCDRLSEPSESHQPALAPCHPTWLQTEGRLWILDLAHGLVSSLSCCCTVQPLWPLNSAHFLNCEACWCRDWLRNSVRNSDISVKNFERVMQFKWLYLPHFLRMCTCRADRVKLTYRTQGKRCKPVKRH